MSLSIALVPVKTRSSPGLTCGPEGQRDSLVAAKSQRWGNYNKGRLTSSISVTILRKRGSLRMAPKAGSTAVSGIIMPWLRSASFQGRERRLARA